jgi:DNA-binding CsgD family transcriptional regulator
MSGLLERETELAQLDALIALVRKGEGALTLVEGAAGIGKTRLLDEACRTARDAGLEVLRARGVALEEEFAFGVVRQLFERPLAAASQRERDELLSGAAALAGALLGFAEGKPTRPAADATFASLHGLYWLTFNLTGIRPLVIAVDDAHWADAASLRFLSFLAARLEGLPVFVLLALRPGEPQVTDGLLAAIRDEAAGHVLTPAELSEHACGQLVADAFGGQADPEFSRACLEVTGGNPFYLTTLVKGLRSDGISPDADSARRVATQVPATVIRALVLRLSRLPQAAGDFARALAVLGPDTGLRDAATLARFDPTKAGAAADALARAGILAQGLPLRFMHPIIQAAVYADLPSAERSRMHLEAARILAAAGAPTERVASHVLAGEPSCDPWAGKVLRDAAAEAIVGAAPESAVRYLERALKEGPTREAIPQIVFELGHAERLAGIPGAIEHLEETIVSTPAVRVRAEAARELALALVFSDRWGDAVDVLERAIADLGDADVSLSQSLEAQLLAAGALHLSTRPVQLEHLNRVIGRELGDSPSERMLLANIALWTASAGAPSSVVRDQAERALAGGRLIAEVTSDSQIAHCAIDALLWTGWLERACYWLDECIADARARGSLIGFLQAVALRSEAYYRLGELFEAEADARAALEAGLPVSWVLAPVAVGAFARVLIDRGQLDEAGELLRTHETPYGVGHPGMANWFGIAQGSLALADGDPSLAAKSFLAVGDWMKAWGERDPELLSWRDGAALALAQAGDLENAQELNAETITLARSGERTRALGIGLRTAGVITGGDDAVELLRDAVEVLAGSAARLEHARALVDLGAALRRRNHRKEAREPLREGVELAHRCGATALVDHGQAELIAAGARPRRIALSGVEALTPSERRVAGLAAEGLSTPEIAQRLFVTVNTVESHLRHAYTKLGIHSREELTSVLTLSDPGRLTAALG